MKSAKSHGLIDFDPTLAVEKPQMGGRCLTGANSKRHLSKTKRNTGIVLVETTLSKNLKIPSEISAKI